MKVFLCGGGAGTQTVRALRRLNEVIRHDLPCLYIPLAMEPDRYDGCLEWITGELGGVDIPGIEMVRSAEELARKNLPDYSFLFLGGGNTFRLLNEIKRVNMFEPIREYLRNGGAAFGGSAGAIVFGEDLESCALDDENEVNLKDTGGFDVLNGISLLCHFTSRDPEHDRRSEEYLLKISEHRKVYALPEEDTLFLNNGRLEAIIDRPYYLFEHGRKTEVPVKDRCDTLEGEHIVLRKARESDYRSMLKHVWGDEEVYRWMLFPPTHTEAEALDRCHRSMEYQKDHLAWFVALKDTDEAVGLCALRENEPGHFEEAGLCVGKAFQGKGYGKEMVSLILELAFTRFGAADVRYGYFRDNLKSRKTAEHFGFVYDRSEELVRPWDGAVKEIDSCLLTRGRYFALKQAAACGRGMNAPSDQLRKGKGNMIQEERL